MSETVEPITGIVLEIIRNRGADGLLNASVECACLADDLAPCGGIQQECVIGYRRICACGDWFMVPSRESTGDKCEVCREY
jgi:hypothetical protein